MSLFVIFTRDTRESSKHGRFPKKIWTLQISRSINTQNSLYGSDIVRQYVALPSGQNAQ